jgi:hypothetical protein
MLYHVSHKNRFTIFDDRGQQNVIESRIQSCILIWGHACLIYVITYFHEQGVATCISKLQVVQRFQTFFSVSATFESTFYTEFAAIMTRARSTNEWAGRFSSLLQPKWLFMATKSSSKDMPRRKPQKAMATISLSHST